jgi:eukaryotic-like serine/threonine-protein kinase
MESDEFQATIIDGSVAASVHADPSVDVSRANVDFVVGDRPQFADETADLLRNRLRAAALALTVILTAAFAGNLIGGTFSLWWLRALILPLLTACWISLRSQRVWSLLQLRAIESIVFGLAVLQVSAMMWTRMSEFATDGETGSVIAIKYLFLGAWCLLILVYGIFMPNTWKRGATMMLPAALMPYLSLTLQRWLVPEVDAILTAETFAAPIPLPLVAALVGVYGTHIINSARREAFKARQFGQYRLLEKLGSGGMGEVYKAEHVLLKRPCAMKLIRPENEVDVTAIAHFEKEVKATAKLTHWNTVEIYDYGHTEDGTFYYVMELLPGLSLEDLAERYGPLPPERVVHLLRQVCGALHEAHAADLIHRDIKPANIFAAQRGGVFDVAKLLDFGLVKERATDSSNDGQGSAGGSFSGTPLYMSPEQAMAYEDVDGRADLYSLGAVAYYLLTGKPPFSGTNVVQLLDAHATKKVVSPSTLRNEIPDDLEQVILKCLAKDPADRFPDSTSLERALAQCEIADTWTVARAEEWWGEHSPELIPADAQLSSPATTDPFGATMPCTPDIMVSDADDPDAETVA